MVLFGSTPCSIQNTGLVAVSASVESENNIGTYKYPVVLLAEIAASSVPNIPNFNVIVVASVGSA